MPHPLTAQDPLTPDEARGLLAMLPAVIEPGLSERELGAIERRWDFRFAPEHRTLLAAGLPSGRSWPDWRGADPGPIAERLAWPADGVLFDVEHNDFWHPAWGPRPGDLAVALAIARERLAEVPVLVPVFGHRFLPGDPETIGNPVFSVQQTDIIYYGSDLADYLHREFGSGGRREAVEAAVRTPFWSSFAEGDDL